MRHRLATALGVIAGITLATFTGFVIFAIFIAYTKPESSHSSTPQSRHEAIPQAMSAAVVQKKPEAIETEAPKIIIGSDYLGFPIYVGRKVRVEEGFIGPDADSPEESAQALITARIVEAADAVRTTYTMSTYRHYGQSGEDSPPSCTVADQDAVSIHHGGVLADGGPSSPIRCDLSDGGTIYATSLMR